MVSAVCWATDLTLPNYSAIEQGAEWEDGGEKEQTGTDDVWPCLEIERTEEVENLKDERRSAQQRIHQRGAKEERLPGMDRADTPQGGHGKRDGRRGQKRA